jgi:hypothetical protein
MMFRQKIIDYAKVNRKAKMVSTICKGWCFRKHASDEAAVISQGMMFSTTGKG